jgi:hypothetical protein
MANAKTQTVEKKNVANTLTEEPNAANLATTASSQTSLVKAELPDYLAPTSREGSQHIERDDMLLPRLALAQKISHELESSHEKFMPELKEGQLFNTVTQRIYGNGPVEFVIIRADKPRWVEFHPRAQGGGIKDMNVPANDPRTQFTRNTTTGVSEPPIATKFYDFIVLLLPSTPGVPELEMIGLSFKSTGLKAARLLNTFIAQRGERPIYAGKYELGVSVGKNAKGIYKVYTVKNSSMANDFCAEPGNPKMAGWVSRDVFGYAREAFLAMKDKAVTIDATTETAEETEGDTNFDPNQFEETRQAEPTDM